MLNASHVRTNRAAFSAASMSSVPAIARGWLATTPTDWPSTCPKPISTFFANSGWTSRKSPSSRTCSITVRMSYGCESESGTRVSSSRSSSVTSSSVSSGGKPGASERLFCGR
ncbi:hypothetical protein D3C74_316680 [compost metagenome]